LPAITPAKLTTTAKLIMSTTKTKPAPNGAASATASPDPSTYRINPEVEAKIDAHIKENPKHWAYLQSMPRERLERTVVLNEVRQLERQQRMREGIMNKINANPELKQAYEILVKNVPEEQREEVMSQGLSDGLHHALPEHHRSGAD
jgi:hypothetical protein